MTSNAKNEKENIYSLKGFDKVFKFTLAQTFKNKAYIVSLVMFILVMSLMGPIQYFSSKSGSSAASGMESHKISNPKTGKIIVLDNTGYALKKDDLKLDEIGLDGADVEILSGDISDKISGLGKNDVCVSISRDMQGYKISAVMADDSDIKSDEINDIASYLSERFNDIKLERSGISNEDIKTIQNGVNTRGAAIEEDYRQEASDEMSHSKMMGLSMVFAILIMIVSTMSSSYIVASVTEEKTSKLVESLLVSVRPMALLMGKICGMMVYIITILVCGFIGSQISNIVMKTVFKIDVTSGISQFDFAALFNFGIGGTIVVIISILLAYIAFGALSGMLGSACTRTEDVQSATGTVMTFVMVGYLGATFMASMNDPMMNTIASFVPPFSFYTSTVYFLAGKISLPVFALSFAIQVLVVIGILLLCAKTYRKLILNDSSKPKFKDILRSIKG